MLAVGKRIFRRNAERRCLAKLADGSLCQEIQDINHAFKNCDAVRGTCDTMTQVLNRMTERNIERNYFGKFFFGIMAKLSITMANM